MPATRQTQKLQDGWGYIHDGRLLDAFSNVEAGWHMFHQQDALSSMAARHEAMRSIGRYDWHEEIAGNTIIAAQFKHEIGIARREDTLMQFLARTGPLDDGVSFDTQL